jgi:signal transduction histidine kinase
MMDAESLEELREFFGITEADLEALSEAREAVDKAADAIVDDFYRHLLQYPDTQRLLRNAEVRKRLLIKQREYLLSLTEPVIDLAYLERREAIGATHERVGIETRWYLGAYARYFSLLVPVLNAHAGAHRPDLQERLTSALSRRLLFDAEIAIRQYVDTREEGLRDLNRELTRESQALTREVGETSRDLRQTQVRAKAAEQLASVATLVTGLAHEIGTPMGVLRGHAEALESAVDGDRDRWRLQMILEQIDRITSIIHSLLNIARPKASLRVPVDLAQIAEISIDFLEEKLRRRGVEAKRDVSGPAMVVGDPEKLQQVFLNLCINAIDAMPDGGTLNLSIHMEGDEEVVVAIRDTGAGISPDSLQSIFAPFYTTKAAGHGSGLGLVVVKGIVEEHGGRISASSDVDEGTTFEARFPSGDSSGHTGPMIVD